MWYQVRRDKWINESKEEENNLWEAYRFKKKMKVSFVVRGHPYIRRQKG